MLQQGVWDFDFFWPSQACDHLPRCILGGCLVQPAIKDDHHHTTFLMMHNGGENGQLCLVSTLHPVLHLLHVGRS